MLAYFKDSLQMMAKHSLVTGLVFIATTLTIIPNYVELLLVIVTALAVVFRLFIDDSYSRLKRFYSMSAD